jgi:hypothetical protein
VDRSGKNRTSATKRANFLAGTQKELSLSTERADFVDKRGLKRFG